MESFIKKISEKNFDESVHIELVKFSKGKFANKYLIDAKKQKDKWSIKTSAEFANFLVRRCLESAPEKINVKGVIVSTMDLRNEVKFPIEKVKQFMGVKQIAVNGEVSSKEIISLMDRFPKAFFALSFSTDKSDLKIKAKAPKSAKPASGGEKEVKADFCSLKTKDESIVRDLFFDMPSFSEISINHTLNINDITLPKNETDPVKIRENAIRKGNIIRKIKADGKESEKEMPFEA